MISILSFLLVLGFGGLPVAGQDTLRAKKNLKILSSAQLHGRGYLKNGAGRTAAFIKKKWKKTGLLPVGDSYYQSFVISQNLFPNPPELRLNASDKILAVDFLPGPTCKSIQGTFRIVRLDSLEIIRRRQKKENHFPREAWVISEKFSSKTFQKNDWTPGLWIQLRSKLTHTLAQKSDEIAEVILKQSSLLPTDTSISVRIQSKTCTNIRTQNVIGRIKGTEFPDSTIIVCAHYDHLGMLGKKVFFPGANDNASGTAMLMEMASSFAKKPARFSMVFIAFSGEEAGLLGSQYFVNHPLLPLSKVKFVMNMDLMGFGDQGATVVNATVYPKYFDKLSEINKKKNYLPEIKARGKAANSDHYPFSEAGVPAFFMYTLGGPGHYHDISDRAETVSFSRFSETFGLLEEFLRTF